VSTRLRLAAVRLKHAFEAMMTMKKIDIAAIEAARRGRLQTGQHALNSRG